MNTNGAVKKILGEIPPVSEIMTAMLPSRNNGDSMVAMNDGISDKRRQRAAMAEDETERRCILTGTKDEYI